MSKTKLAVFVMTIFLALVLPVFAAAQKSLPVLTSISPTSTTAGAAVTITATGSNFASGALILWNGVSLTTTLVSKSVLTAPLTSVQVGTAGTDKVSVYVAGRFGGTSAALSFTVNPAPTTTTSTTTTTTTTGPLAITTTSVPTGTTGTAYSATLAASGGTAPYSWSVGSGALPPGLALSAAGAISGTPTTSGSYAFVGTVKDSASGTTSYTYSATIGQGTASLAISTTSVPAATAGTAYPATTLAATGGNGGPYTFTVASGTIPPGLTLSSTGGISGTPTTAAGYSFSIQAKDSANNTATQNYSMTVAAATASTTTSASTVLLSNSLNSGALGTWSSVLGNVTYNSNLTYVYPGEAGSGQIHYMACGGGGSAACNGAAADVDDSFEYCCQTGLNHFTIEGKVFFKQPEADGTADGIARKIFYLFDTPGGNNYHWSIVLTTFASNGTLALTFAEQSGPVGGGSYNYDCGTTPALCATLNYNTWYDIKMEIQNDTATSSPYNGICRIWVNGTQVFNVTSFDFNHGNNYPITDFRIGMQADTTNGSPIDEYRYWSDVVITQLNP